MMNVHTHEQIKISSLYSITIKQFTSTNSFLDFPLVTKLHIPTALHASDLILKELQSKGVVINKFTLVGWLGEKLKLGVNNKEDYVTLVGSHKWPTKINGINIVIAKPRYVPDSFVLVVRYVPRELEGHFISNEIQRMIVSADRIKRIHYSYQRRTYDYRFDVKDYSEYNAVLQLGRIAIGHSWLSINKFYPGNCLTYCTKCWCIGHLRNKCNSENKCRICLENLMVDTPYMCKNEPKCAQCDGTHHSLDSQCQVIKEYKDQLKENVEDAIQKGLLQRLSLQEKLPIFELPTLTSGKSERISLVSVANEYYSRFHVASSRLINGFQLNHQAQLIPTSHNNSIVQTDQQPSSIYKSTQNGWDTRVVEAIDLVYKVQASICIFTEGANKNGGVCIAVGGHLKATRIEVNIPNTVIIDITGLSEPVRIIGIYWPTSQQRDLDEIQPFVIEGTILSGDFNATVKE
ncbi:unnamed protein product [Rotaria socialis]|uniref:Uncharacterized protein n=1 Tax=Rotaria socialis TaxID=392032 RepID=A0A821C4Q8_9BILA|nr:unnamed protein product [Rotaria socialis]